MARILFHVDLNAFFASAEELRHPELKGKPLAVGSTSSRGVLSTANYAARKKGIHSAMPTQQALKIDPDLVVIPGDHDYYHKLSDEFFALLQTFTPLVEKASIDEGYMDVTDIIKRYPRPLDLAVAIQQAVDQKLGLQVSIGVAPTRFLAKIASDMKKPRGITVLRKSDIQKKLWPLPVETLPGIGKKNLPLLQEKGIKTVRDLADPKNREVLEPILQSRYTKLIEALTGKSSDKLELESQRKSISHSVTFRNDLYSLEEMKDPVYQMTRELVRRLDEKGMSAKNLAIQFKDRNFEAHMHSRSFPSAIHDFDSIYLEVRNLMEQFFEPVGYRFFAIRLGGLQSRDLKQYNLFEQDMTQNFIDHFNGKLNASLLMKTSDLLKKGKTDEPDT